MAKAPKPAHVRLNGDVKAPKHKRKRLTARTENMTEKRWQTIINAIANGVHRKDACKEANISPMTLDAFLISNVAASNQLREAHLVYTRRQWPIDLIEAVLQGIAAGKTLKQSALDCDVPEEKHGSLNLILLKDAAIRKMYDEARELQAESFLDEIVDISDDTKNDRLANGKGDHELVNRSRLRVDTRKFAMGAMVKRRFGDYKAVEHSGELNINHAAVLTGGRKRLEQLHQKRKGATIDNETGAVE
jgi:hypothetical protein